MQTRIHHTAEHLRAKLHKNNNLSTARTWLAVKSKKIMLEHNQNALSNVNRAQKLIIF